MATTSSKNLFDKSGRLEPDSRLLLRSGPIGAIIRSLHEGCPEPAPRAPSQILVERRGIIIDAKSGALGAGRSPKLPYHFPECNESLTAYGVGRHRHPPEIDQVLTEVGTAGGRGEPVGVIFMPHPVPMDRGIFATIYAQPKRTAVEHDLIELERSLSADSRFVRVVGHLPATKDSAHTDLCDITVHVVHGRIVVLACLGNLIQGAARAAVQNPYGRADANFRSRVTGSKISTSHSQESVCFSSP